MLVISRKNTGEGREAKAKLTRAGLPRKKPGPKPRSIAQIQAAATPDPVTICTQAYDSAPDPDTAAAAYRKAMPRIDHVGIAGWAELVAQGMARRVFTGKEASTMLYAAQVAASSRNRR